MLPSDAMQITPKQESSWRAVEEALAKLRFNLEAELAKVRGMDPRSRDHRPFPVTL